MSAVYDYRGPVADAVVAAKVRGARAGWPVLADHLRARIDLHVAVDVVTWVTTGPKRVRDRGVDHAQILARRAGELLDAPCVKLLDAVEGASDADQYRTRRRLPGTNVLLVDDVVTTGATAWRAAAALRAGGAGTVELAVIARAGNHPLGAAHR